MNILYLLKKAFGSIASKYFFATIAICFALTNKLLARAGGGGGGHSSGGHSSGGGGGFGGGHGFYVPGGGGGMSPSVVVLIIIIVVIYVVVKGRKGGAKAEMEGGNETLNMPSQPFPDGLDKAKVQTSFLEIQSAWQQKDLKNVRKWISDGVYQRYTAQFQMMNKLSQVNKLTNIQVSGIKLAKTTLDGNYQTADVAISFTMDDEFLSNKYPSFNERFMGDSDTEVWKFIKKKGAQEGKNLYDNNNCPNCGAPFETKMGEISRCSQCGTLTNNATYDWVLSEITQVDDYNGTPGLETNQELNELTQNDSLFAVQRVEDIASNVFMQIMEVLTGESDKKLARFAEPETVAAILKQKATMGSIVFDRLYLNDVTLSSFNTTNERLNLVFSLTATFQRVRAGQTLTLIDPEMASANYQMVLTKNLKGLQTPAKETVYSYECSNCGAPFADTTNDVCPYCGTAVIDFNRNWVLTEFKM
jgi:DNA-directed RNA polymerase subunit RPC12/RpoP/predicted lipid-binding transport protein (Tim44 family)